MAGEKAEAAKYFSLFTLFQPNRLAAGEADAMTGAVVLLGGATLLFDVGIAVFTKKDLHI